MNLAGRGIDPGLDLPLELVREWIEKIVGAREVWGGQVRVRGWKCWAGEARGG